MLSDDAIAPVLTQRLRDCAPCAPLAEQGRIIRRAIARARELGLRLPADVRLCPDGRDPGLRLPAGFGIFTVDGAALRAHMNAPLQAGDYDYEEAGPSRARFATWLDVGSGVWPENLAWTTLHELRHAHDATTGRAWDRPAWERSAIEFAARAMATWPW